MTGRCWPKGTPHEQIPWMAEGISIEEWRRRQTREELVDPVRERDRERAKQEAEKRAAQRPERRRK